MYWKDIENFLSKLTARRVWNAAKVYLSYHISRWAKRPVQWGVPMTVSIEPTTACNLRCPECPSGLRAFTRPTGNLKSDFFRSTIDQMADRLIYLIFYFQGEPYINPDFLDMVDYASSKGLYTITSTNAHFLTDENARRTIESGLDRLIISIDGTTQDVYGNYRVQGDLDKVIDGAKRVVYWRDKLKSKTPHLIFQFLVVRQNEHQIPEIYTLARSIGIDEVKLKSIQVYDYENGHPLLPENQTYSRYHKGKDGKYALKHKLINHCWKLWHANVITWDGKIVPCCFDKDAKYKLGDLEQDTFIDIWKGGAYNNFRKNIMAGRNKIDICQNCTEGCKVWL